MSKTANTPKSGSTTVRNYDPKNVPNSKGASKGSGVKIAKMYNPPKGAQKGNPPSGRK